MSGSQVRMLDVRHVRQLAAVIQEHYKRGAYGVIPELDAASESRRVHVFHVVSHLSLVEYVRRLLSHQDPYDDHFHRGLMRSENGSVLHRVLGLTDEQAAVFDSLLDGRLDLTVDNLGEFVDLARAICTEPSR